MLRTIREISPRWIVGENVRGLTNWNGGVVFDEVQADLETQGYEVLPFLLPACAVNAPHRRDRIWFIAYACGNGGREYAGGMGDSAEQDKGQVGGKIFNAVEPNGQTGLTPYTRLLGQKECEIETAGIEQCGKGNDVANAERRGGLQVCDNLQRGFANGNKFNAVNEQTNWLNFPTQPPVCSGDDELPRELDGITFSKWRNESIKGYGNAVVPKLVLEIFKPIESYEQLTTPSPVGRGTKRKK
jgi:DNA (cytosine-5)-methyltransferase 1